MFIEVGGIEGPNVGKTERPVIPIPLYAVAAVHERPGEFIPSYGFDIATYQIVEPSCVGRALAKLLRREPTAYIHPTGRLR
jgi:hypothetical protein